MPRSDTGARWRVVPASIAGGDHIERGEGCQDNWSALGLGGGVHVLAVADGAGSCSRGAHGALFAVTGAKQAGAEVFGRGAPTTYQGWGEAIHAFGNLCFTYFDDQVEAALRVSHSRHRREDFGTTLLTAVVAAPWFAFFGVGDGVLILDREPGSARMLAGPVTDRDYTAKTTFLTSAERNEAPDWGVVHDAGVVGLALCTDGLTEALLSLQAASGPDGGARGFYLPDPAFRDYLTFYQNPDVQALSLARHLFGEEFGATSGDDKTIVLAVRMS